MLSRFDQWLLFAPLWSIGLFVFGGMLASSSLASALRRRHERRSAKLNVHDLNSDADEGLMVSAVMGLLALLVAFTFSIAINRFESRRENVVNEANAIGTTYLRAQLLPEPHRAYISRLLLQYTENRIVLARAHRGPGQDELLRRSDRLLSDLWTATTAALPSIRSYPFSAVFLEAMNTLIDMDTTRKAGRQAHVPSAVFLVLLLYQFMAAGVISYAVMGHGGRRTAIVLFMLLAVLLILIIDVDRPTSGGVTEAQDSMLQLRDFLSSHPPSSFGSGNVYLAR